jgi:hypothetical protein
VASMSFINFAAKVSVFPNVVFCFWNGKVDHSIIRLQALLGPLLASSPPGVAQIGTGWGSTRKVLNTRSTRSNKELVEASVHACLGKLVLSDPQPKVYSGDVF